MKKLALLLMLFSSNAYANTIVLDPISADSTISAYSNNFTKISNLVNGNIEGSTDSGASVSNVKADSIFEINMGDDANPRLRDSELLNITYDTTTSQNSYVYTGCTPATDSDLTSDISACTAYVNGYRVVKSATSQTYTASRDTYVDLSQTGTYTLSAVVNGATAPSVAANSARLAKVVTDGTTITTVTDLANRRIPGLIVPTNYRDSLVISKDSTTTITVLPGSFEINNAMITKTTPTTLTISTAGDWAGGTSLRAADTYGFVGSDASGNLKLHTTAPTHTNYGVSVTSGKKRYATWSSTVYRILGWFYMNGAQNIDNASNIKDMSVTNTIISSDETFLAFTSTSYANIMDVKFYNSGGNILIMNQISADAAGGGFDAAFLKCTRNGSAIPGCGSGDGTGGAGGGIGNTAIYLDRNRPQGTATYGTQFKIGANQANFQSRNLVLEEQ